MALGSLQDEADLKRWLEQEVAQPGLVPGVGADNLPAGTVLWSAASDAPDGYLLADGSTVSRTAYARLFDAIGTTYGAGDGSTTFALPNLKGRVAAGLDAGQTEFDALGETGGAKTHTLQTSEIPSHSHAISADQQGNTTAGGGSNRLSNLSDGTSGNNDATSANAGGDGAHNNLQPYIVLNPIIKV